MGSRNNFGTWGGQLITLLSFLLVINLADCSRGDQGNPVVVRVNGLDITLADFQAFYRPLPTEQNTLEEQILTLDQKIEELIGFKLVQEGGRNDGLHRTDDFKRRREKHIKDLLNRLVKKLEIVDVITVTDTEIEDLIARSLVERHFKHIITMNQLGAEEVEKQLKAGEEWGGVAIQFSRDSEAGLHRGDLGWLAWGEGPFSVYPELQPIAYQIPVGTWQGPIQVGREYHFIMVVEERPRERGTPEEEWQAAGSRLYNLKLEGMEQELSNRMWTGGGFHLDEDQFRWLYDQIIESFRRNPANNPVPVLSKEDSRRIVVRSDSNPYTTRDFLEKLELLNPRERDNILSLDEWRNLFVGWVIIDRVSEYATSKGYRRDPAIMAGYKTFTDSRLYALKLEALKAEARPATDEEIGEYFEQNPQFFSLPEQRQIVEVLVETREEAQKILLRAQAGEDMEALAREYTIRPEFAQKGGVFAPIRRNEFGSLGEAVFEVEKDQLGPVVETPLGFSVFKVIRIVPPREIKLDDVRNNLRETFRLEMERMIVDEFKRRERARARVWKDEKFFEEWAAEIIVWRASLSDSLTQGTGQRQPQVKR